MAIQSQTICKNIQKAHKNTFTPVALAAANRSKIFGRAVKPLDALRPHENTVFPPPLTLQALVLHSPDALIHNNMPTVTSPSKSS